MKYLLVLIVLLLIGCSINVSCSIDSSSDPNARAKRFAAVLDTLTARHCSISLTARSVLRTAVNNAVAPHELAITCPRDAIEIPAARALDLGVIGTALQLGTVMYCGSIELQVLVHLAFAERVSDGRGFSVYCDPPLIGSG